MLLYLLRGMCMDVLAMQVITIPVLYPIIVALGIDPVWCGVFVVLMCELGMITPPVGMNLFVVQSVRKDSGPIADVMWGALPYAGIMLLFYAAADGPAADRALAAESDVVSKYLVGHRVGIRGPGPP